jgi:hypothetical protein
MKLRRKTLPEYRHIKHERNFRKNPDVFGLPLPSTVMNVISGTSMMEGFVAGA